MPDESPWNSGRTGDPDHGQYRPSRLSDDLLGILAGCRENTVPLIHILRSIRGRGFLLFMIFLALPFLIPVPLPGLSTPLGFLFMFFGLRIAFGKRPLWTRWLLRRRIAFATLKELIERSVRGVRFVEKLLRPRMHFLQHWRLFRLVNGLTIFSGGLALCLPIPIPATNFIPALGIVLLCMGMMEADGYFILAGYLVSVCAWLYLLLLVWLGRVGLHELPFLGGHGPPS